MKIQNMTENQIFKSFINDIAKGNTVQLHAFPVQLKSALKKGFLESEMKHDSFIIRRSDKRGAKTTLLKIAKSL